MFFHCWFCFFLPECQNKRIQCLGLGMELSFSLKIKLRSYEFSCKFAVCRWSMITEEPLLSPCVVCFQILRNMEIDDNTQVWNFATKDWFYTNTTQEWKSGSVNSDIIHLGSSLPTSVCLCLGLKFTANKSNTVFHPL